MFLEHLRAARDRSQHLNHAAGVEFVGRRSALDVLRGAAKLGVNLGQRADACGSIVRRRGHPQEPDLR